MAQRGRKKGASGEESRALLLKVAAEEFARDGYHSTKVSSIVKKAGLTQPSFYLYFNSKEAIFEELVTVFRTNLFDLVKNSRVGKDTKPDELPDRITQGLTMVFEFFKNNPSITRIGFFVAAEAEEIKKQLAAGIKENLIAEQHEGYFIQDIDMNTVAECLVGIIERLTMAVLFEGKKGPETIATEVVYLLLYGMDAAGVKKAE